MKRVIFLVVGIIVVVVALALVIWAIGAIGGGEENGESELQNQGFGIASFEECVEAGYPIMESYPRQCRTPDGTLFIEDGSVEPGEVNAPDSTQEAPSYNY